MQVDKDRSSGLRLNSRALLPKTRASSWKCDGLQGSRRASAVLPLRQAAATRITALDIVKSWADLTQSGEFKMHQTVYRRRKFQMNWGGELNFLLAGECAPFSFVFPPIQQIVGALREDKQVRILQGTKGKSLDKRDIAAEFRAAPLESALAMPFQMSHFNLANFYGPTQFLHRFEEQVMEPWKKFLIECGFTWERCYPIIFSSGSDCATNYHLDVSHVLAWQIDGKKIFSGLKDPERWAPIGKMVQENQRKAVSKPDLLEADDVLAYVMKPGDVLWNQILTPHWVDATDEVACSINISHGGLRLKGKLCHREEKLEAWLMSHPEERWKKPY